MGSKTGAQQQETIRPALFLPKKGSSIEGKSLGEINEISTHVRYPLPLRTCNRSLKADEMTHERARAQAMLETSNRSLF